MNMKFNILLGVNNFEKKNREYDNIPNIPMNQIQQVVKSDFFLIVLAFYEHILLGTNQS